jgi:selenide,water dikinase
VRGLTPDPPPELLVGLATGDDAAVWRIGRGRALVLTADFITPVVDDARTWGRIAAANSASDVYAMGGRPLLALNLVAWNSEELSNDLLTEVLAGGEDVARSCGFVVGGGHTVDDPEPKYGMAVVGEVNPSRMLTNSQLRPGNALVLTKPLGTGVISTAIKQGEARADIVDRAVQEMTRSNEAAAAAAMRHGATAATDVTGFGLLGHGLRMAQESGVDLEVSVGEVPVIEGARELAALGIVPGGTSRNLDWVTPCLDVGDTSDVSVMLLADAQTSGGLLLGMVSHDAGLAAVTELRLSGHEAAVIGEVTEGSGQIRLLP